MDIKGAQLEVDNWIKEHGVRYFNELTNMAQLTEAVGEVARIIARRYGEQSEEESDKNKDLGEELINHAQRYLDENRTELNSFNRISARIIIDRVLHENAIEFIKRNY